MTYGRDPTPGYHDVHAMASPYYTNRTWHGYQPKGWTGHSFLQTDATEGAKDDDYEFEDSTGERWVKFAKTWGVEPNNPPYHDPLFFTRKGFMDSVLQTPETAKEDYVPKKKSKETKKESNDKKDTSFIQLDSVYAPSEPFDPNLEDTQKIMNYYKNEDIVKEYKKKAWAIPGDPTGGFSTIYA